MTHPVRIIYPDLRHRSKATHLGWTRYGDANQYHGSPHHGPVFRVCLVRLDRGDLQQCIRSDLSFMRCTLVSVGLGTGA
jgi:hypothetical protein